MLLISPVSFIGALLVVWLIARHCSGMVGLAPDDISRATWVPWVVGAIVAIVTTWIWGGLRAPSVVHDESAYLLQAALFARGHWSLPSPPLLAPFTQAAVLLTPVLAPKMAPGHALLLVPGLWLGLPGLMPMVLLGISAAIMVMLARRIAGTAVALLTVVIWLVQPGQQRWRAGYYSETTSGVMWLASWWALVRWREGRDVRWLLAIALMVGWGAITRPLTMLAFAIPLGGVVLWDVGRRRLWGQLAAALVVGTVPLVLMLVQNRAITGHVLESPLTLYTRQYVPFDRMGFGLDTTPPLLHLPADLDQSGAGFRARHAEHQLAALPRILITRWRSAVQPAFSGWRIVLIPAALAGIWLAGPAGWFALATALMVYFGYLGYAHEPYWTLYYAETTPIVAFIVAVGVWRIMIWCTSSKGSPILGTVGVAALVLLFGAGDLRNARLFRANEQRPFRQFTDQVARLDGDHMLVFVHYGPHHNPDASFVRNSADPAHAPFLTAYDLGPAMNAQVATAYPDRKPYLWDEASGELTPLR